MQSQFVPKDQSIRFNRNGGDPDLAAQTKKQDALSAAALVNRRNALLQDYNKTHHKPAWSPAFSAAVRVLLIIRVASAMYSTIKDCDETFNYWEPLHLLVYPPTGTARPQAPFQTWEYAPQFAIRSWAYISKFVPPAQFLARLGVGKRQVFFTVRILLGGTSTFVEARFYKAVADTFNSRIGRYLLVMLAVSAGMFEASTSLLPQTYAMYAVMLAYSFWLPPARLPSSDPSVLATPQQRPFKPWRLFCAVNAFALSGILGWPFALVLSAPFLVEQLLCRGDDVVAPNRVASWIATRWTTFVGASLIAALWALPLWTIDTLAYGRSVLVPFNIIRYNVLSAARGAGPELYGTEPTSYYFANLALNFNVLLPLALLSAPLLLVTAIYDPKRLQRPLEQPSAAGAGAGAGAKGHAAKPEPSSLLTLNALRISPFYLWFVLLSLQPHKEERFMYPAYPLLCMNAAISLYLVRSLLEVGYVRYTRSPYKASRSRLFTNVTASLLGLTILLGTLRTVGQLAHFHAPFDVLFHLEGYELPRVVAMHFPETLNADVRARLAKGLPAVASDEEREYNERGKGVDNAGRSQDLSISLKPLERLPRPLRLCYGKEWHRFPTHFLVPFGVEVEFIQSEFDGILPAHFHIDAVSSHSAGGGRADAAVEEGVATTLDSLFGRHLWPLAPITRSTRGSFNDLNTQELDRFVPPSSCDYLVDLDNSHRYLSPTTVPSPLEPRYAQDEGEGWERVHCVPFLDAEWSRPVHADQDGILRRTAAKVVAVVARSLWIPTSLGGKGANLYGDYCLLRNKASELVA